MIEADSEDLHLKHTRYTCPPFRRIGETR
jgi:hypothetical protein